MTLCAYESEISAAGASMSSFFFPATVLPAASAFLRPVMNACRAVAFATGPAAAATLASIASMEAFKAMSASADACEEAVRSMTF